MERSRPDTSAPGTTAAALTAAGIPVTEEGKARARAKLTAARERWTPDLDAAAREQVGLPPASRAA